MRIFPCEFPYGKALFYFGTQQCVPCKTLKPILYDIEEEYGDDIPFYECDVSYNSLYRDMFAVMSVPTVILLQFRKTDRVELGRLVGCYPRERYINLLKK